MLLRILFILTVSSLILVFIYNRNFVRLFQVFQIPVQYPKESIVAYSTQPPIVHYCSHNYMVAFTFDDGPHPITTPVIVQVLNQQRIKAGFFMLGTAIQSFLSAHHSLTVHLMERPTLEFLLLQNYSLLDTIFEGHNIYLHGWQHENNHEMRLQAVVDNIATQLVEIGVLKAFRPIYRAPKGIAINPKNIKENALLVQILNQMGIIPTYWDLDTKDWKQSVNENHLINFTLQEICEKKGGLILMHDNRPMTAYSLDRMIRSIKASGHTIVSPSAINSKWNDRTIIDQTKQYIELLRRRIRNTQNDHSIDTNDRNPFRPVEVSLGTNESKRKLLRTINPQASHQDSLIVAPNINDV